MATVPSRPNSPERSEAQVVTRYLPNGYTAQFEGSDQALPCSWPRMSREEAAVSDDQQQGQSSLKLQGGDIHRDLFKKTRPKPQQKRAATFHATRASPDADDAADEAMPVAEQLAPGGFRRAFLRHRKNAHATAIAGTGSFVEFLSLYGHFAGEDLSDSDGEDTARHDSDPERRSLLGRRRNCKRGAPVQATNGLWKTFLTLLKAFIGTGIMFLPKAFRNGGILFASATLLLVSAVTMLAFHLVLSCKRHHKSAHGDMSYGDIGLAVSGPPMRAVILCSITISQLGFVCTGIVFVAENMLTVSKALWDGNVSTTALVLVQLTVLVPLSLTRNIGKLGPAAMVADGFILLGLAYIYYFDVSSLVERGGPDPSMVLFNPAKYTLTVGAAIFTFEGIGLLMPIESGMKEPQQFEWLLGLVMAIITVVFTSVGALCYATFGAATETEVIDNLPQDSRLVNTVQLLYALAVLVGNPVQLFPALRILETAIFGHRASGRQSLRTKWLKNAQRALMVCACATVAIVCAGELDRFVALIGAVACVPLVYMYPAYLHYCGVATGPWEKGGDVMLMVGGVCAMVYTTVVTVLDGFVS